MRDRFYDTHVDDGMRHSGLVPSRAEREQTRETRQVAQDAYQRGVADAVAKVKKMRTTHLKLASQMAGASRDLQKIRAEECEDVVAELEALLPLEKRNER